MTNGIQTVFTRFLTERARRLAPMGLRITFERDADSEAIVAHMWVTDGRVFGKARAIKRYVPQGVFVTIAPEHQPALTWYLTAKAGFTKVAQLEGLDILLKTE